MLKRKKVLTVGTSRPERLVSFLKRLGLGECERVNLRAEIVIIRKPNGLYYVRDK